MTQSSTTPAEKGALETGVLILSGDLAFLIESYLNNHDQDDWSLERPINVDPLRMSELISVWGRLRDKLTELRALRAEKGSA